MTITWQASIAGYVPKPKDKPFIKQPNKTIINISLIKQANEIEIGEKMVSFFLKYLFINKIDTINMAVNTVKATETLILKVKSILYVDEYSLIESCVKT